MAVYEEWRIFADGFGVTIMTSVFGLLLPLSLGTILGVTGTAPNKICRRINRFYVELFQNTPIVIQIFFLYSGLPHLGVTLPVFTLGVFNGKKLIRNYDIQHVSA